VSSGEVYSDWKSLPGGELLQAQIDALYERKQYKEYVVLVETLMVDIWSKATFQSIEYDFFLSKRYQSRPDVPKFSKKKKKNETIGY
jgi:hypothetical protein